MAVQQHQRSCENSLAGGQSLRHLPEQLQPEQVAERIERKDRA